MSKRDEAMARLLLVLADYLACVPVTPGAGNQHRALLFAASDLRTVLDRPAPARAPKRRRRSK